MLQAAARRLAPYAYRSASHHLPSSQIFQRAQFCSKPPEKYTHKFTVVSDQTNLPRDGARRALKNVLPKGYHVKKDTFPRPKQGYWTTKEKCAIAGSLVVGAAVVRHSIEPAYEVGCFAVSVAAATGVFVVSEAIDMAIFGAKCASYGWEAAAEWGSNLSKQEESEK